MLARVLLVAVVACSREKAPAPTAATTATTGTMTDAKQPPIRFTAVAAAKIREIRAAEGIEAGMPLRVEVRDAPAAPAGFEYNLYFDDEKRPGDRELEANGIHIVLDPHSLTSLDGTEIDFVETAQGAGFKYNNPNVPGGMDAPTGTPTFGTLE